MLPMVLAALCAIDGDFRLAHGLHPGYRSRMQGCTLAIVRLSLRSDRSLGIELTSSRRDWHDVGI